jgi:hypothetical protein
VLLPAHCVESKKIMGVTQLELPIFLFQNNLEADGTVFEVSEIIVHPDWDILSKSYEADIAIAILNEPVIMSTSVTNICLNSPSKLAEDFIGQYAIVCGWGHSKISDYQQVDNLRAVTVPIVDKKYCNESRVFREITSNKLFCAGSTDKEAGACKGKQNYF